MQQESDKAMASEQRAKSDMEHEALLRLQAVEQASSASRAEEETKAAKAAAEAVIETLRVQVRHDYLEAHRLAHCFRNTYFRDRTFRTSKLEARQSKTARELDWHLDTYRSMIIVLDFQRVTRENVGAGLNNERLCRSDGCWVNLIPRLHQCGKSTYVYPKAIGENYARGSIRGENIVHVRMRIRRR